MKLFKIILGSVLCLPVLGVATNMQTMPMGIQTTPDTQLQNIGKALAQLHTDLVGIKSQSQTNYQNTVTREINARVPKNNEDFLLNLSGYDSFVNDYIYKAPLQNLDTGYSYAYACQTVSELKTPFCHDGSKASAQGLDVDSIMPFGNSLSSFSFSTGYIDSLLESVRYAGSVRSAEKQLPSASIVYRVLNNVGNQYDTTSGGNLPAGKLSSRMQQLQKVVAAPFTPSYQKALATSSTAEAIRAVAQDGSVANLMKYQQIKQGQSVQVLLSGILVQQMRTNYLLEQNLKFLKKLAKTDKGV